MNEEFERELAEDWSEAMENLDLELSDEIVGIEIGVADQMEFEED